MVVKIKKKPVHENEPGKDLRRERERSQHRAGMGMRSAHPANGKVSGWSRARGGVKHGE